MRTSSIANEHPDPFDQQKTMPMVQTKEGLHVQMLVQMLVHLLVHLLVQILFAVASFTFEAG